VQHPGAVKHHRVVVDTHDQKVRSLGHLSNVISVS